MVLTCSFAIASKIRPILVTPDDLQTSRLGLVSKFERLVLVLSRLVRPTSRSFQDRGLRKQPNQALVF